MKSRHWFLLFGTVFILCAVCIILLLTHQPKALTAEIYQNGILIQTIDLTTLKESKEILLTDGEKENVVLAEPGQISMCFANCPDRLCVRQGVIRNGIYPIVCLPNKVVIRLISAKKPSVDTITK